MDILLFVKYIFRNMRIVNGANVSYTHIFYRSSAYDFGLRVNLENNYLRNSELSARFSQLERDQPNTVEFIFNDSLINAALYSLKISHNVSMISNGSHILLYYPFYSIENSTDGIS